MRKVGVSGRYGRSIGVVACGAIGLVATACGAKEDLPPPLAEPGGRGAGGSGAHEDSGPADDAGQDTAIESGNGSGTLGWPALFEKCASDVKMQEEGANGTPADPYFCFATTMGHPAENSDARNFLTPLVKVTLTVDAADAVFETRASAYWGVVLTAPTGQKLMPGMRYDTSNNDGTAIHFRWDKGPCPPDSDAGDFETGIFDIRELTWEATNTITSAAIDFKQTCGNSAPLYGRVRYKTNVPL